MSEELYDYERHEAPLGDGLIKQLTTMWEDAFGGSFHWIEDELKREPGVTKNIIYLVRNKEKIVSTCRMGRRCFAPYVGILGEVLTLEEHRGHGLARKLCSMATGEFDQNHGHALFLATGNSAAAKLYSSMGWEHMPNMAAMLRVSEGKNEDFFVNYFEKEKELSATIYPGNSNYQHTIVPIILTRHDLTLLDWNTSLLSTQYFVQSSCEALYPRYKELETTGTWFVLKRDDGVIVGLASVKYQNNDVYSVDAFAHYDYQLDWLKPLYQDAITWAYNNGAQSIQVFCAEQDEFKKNVLEESSFEMIGKAKPFECTGVKLETFLFNHVK
jgi:GNAT superfamily N-acetyltransferase